MKNSISSSDWKLKFWKSLKSTHLVTRTSCKLKETSSLEDTSYTTPYPVHRHRNAQYERLQLH